MTVIAFVGKPRTGKTLHMTIMAHDDYQKGYKIFSNYQLNFPHKRLSVESMLKIPFDDVERNPKTLCIQEADKVFDSRRSMRNENVLLSSLTGQSGKRNLNIYYDTQFFNRIDSSLRDVTEYMIVSSVYVDSLTKEPICFEYTMIDLYDYSQKHYKIPVPIIRPFFNMYDSYATTKPIIESKSMDDIIGGDGIKSGKKSRFKNA